MKKIPFSPKQNGYLTEIYRRINYFHDGDLDVKLLVTFFPSESKYLRENGYIKLSSGSLTPRITDWYCLTEKGKELFKNHYSYGTKMSDKECHSIFDGNTTYTFFKN